MYRTWIISVSGRKLLYSRHFPHLEKHDNFNFPRISPNDFMKSIFSSLGIDFTHPGSGESHNSTSTLNIDYDYNKMSRSSSSSSLNSLISTTSSKILDGSVSEYSFSSAENSMLHNYLPLIVCRFMSSPRENQYSGEEHQKFAFIDLIMLVFEKNGYLFVCCPRLETCSRLSCTNLDTSYEKLLLEEQSISLAYTTMQLFSNEFFAKKKSIKELELFITNYMPFGTLTKNGLESNQSRYNTRSEKKANKSDNEGLIRLCINEFVSTSFQPFNRTSPSGKEAIFGTLSIDFSALDISAFSKAELRLSVNNLESFFTAKPANCDTINATTLNYDMMFSKMDPVNILHYRGNSSDDGSKPLSSPSLDSVPNLRKLFSYKYIITKKDSTISKSLISTKNCHHFSITIQFNTKILLDEVKFAYFMVKFAFNQEKSKKEVQTMDSSVSNLMVRESVKASFGQVRIEGSNFIWVLGQKIPRSTRLSLDFDLLIEEEKLANLDTVCNFKYDYKMAARLSYLKKIPSIGENLNHSKTVTTQNESRDLEEIRECNLKYVTKSIEPQLQISKMVLHTELESSKVVRTVANERREEAKWSNTAIVEYHLCSFEYRLLPDLALVTATRKSEPA